MCLPRYLPNKKTPSPPPYRGIVTIKHPSLHRNPLPYGKKQQRHKKELLRPQNNQIQIDFGTFKWEQLFKTDPELLLVRVALDGAA